jgi:hypothetical protein
LKWGVLEDIAGTIGAHPTRSEAIHEAAPGMGTRLAFLIDAKTNLVETNLV